MEIWEADHSLLEIDANAHSLETSAPITDQHHIIMLSEIFIIIKNSSGNAAQKNYFLISALVFQHFRYERSFSIWYKTNS